MADLRTLLGDKYDAMIEKASVSVVFCRHPVERTPKRLVRLAAALHMTGELARIEREVEAALAAVLPDLLAEANTRAEDAEAKARRFANLLGNNAKALNDVLPREVLRQKAEAWDEGYAQAQYTHCEAKQPCDAIDINPYAEEATDDHA